MKANPLFQEKQRFKQWWLWLLLISSMIPLVISIIQSHDPITFETILFGIFVPLLLIILFLTVYLETIITQEGIYVRFFPLHLSFKHYSWQQIEKVYTKKYSPLSDYGGWGLRYSFKLGKAYNISGNQGLQLILTNKSKLLIGTQKSEEINRILVRINQLKK